MTSLLNHVGFARRRARQRFHHSLELLRQGGRNLVILGSQRKRDGALYLLDVAGDAQHTGVGRETGIEERLAGNLVAVAQEDDMLAAPAEARCSNGLCGTLVLAQLLKKALDNGEGLARVAVVEERDDVKNSPEEVVAIKT